MVTREEFRQLIHRFDENEQELERVSSTLLSGYQTHYEHMLNARPTWTDVEDMLRSKCDLEEAKALEERVKRQENLFALTDNRADGHEEKIQDMEAQLRQKFEHLQGEVETLRAQITDLTQHQTLAALDSLELEVPRVKKKPLEDVVNILRDPKTTTGV